MLNVFYTYSYAWIVVLILYKLGWSDLCLPLDKGLSIFLIISIVFSFIIGKSIDKNFKFIILSENPHRNKKITYYLIFFYFIDFIYAKKIPLLSVLSGIPIRKCFI